MPSSPGAAAQWERPAREASVPELRGAVQGFISEHGAGKTVLSDVALAVSEAVTNAVMHAFLDREEGTVRVAVRAGVDQIVVIVADDGRGMQPRADSPGLGMGLPLIGQLAASLDIRVPAGGGTELCMTFAAPGVHGPEVGLLRAPPGWAQLLDDVGRVAQGAWPGEGVSGLVDLLVPAVADACAVDVVDEHGTPQRFAGRIDGPDGERQSAWLASLRPRADAPRSATLAALTKAGASLAELTEDHIAAVTTNPQDAAAMAATGIRWWAVAGLREGDRLLGLLHLGTRAARGKPSPDLLDLIGRIAERASRGLAVTQLVAELQRTRRRFEGILDVLAEAVTVNDVDGRVVWCNDAAVRLLGVESRDDVLRAEPGELVDRFEILHVDGTPVRPDELPGRRALAGLDAPPLLTRSIHRATGVERRLLTKATLLHDHERLAVNIIEDLTDAQAPPRLR
jgi:anti-sigma regulatory factor (Ser/Thr protein kinase)/PAS domain-containing protein